MRSIALVEHLEYEVLGHINTKALIVGDVDNDEKNELIAGNTLGEIVIFKGSKKKPWCKCSDLGINVLLVITLEGYLYVFIIKSSSVSEENTDPLKPTYRQHIPTNGRTLFVGDIDNDGKNELVIGFSDRKVQSYRWSQVTENSGLFVLMETWHLAGQMGSLILQVNPIGDKHELLVSQPGGSFASLLPKVSSARPTDKPTNSSLIYHPLDSAQARNPAISTEIVGSVKGLDSAGEVKLFSAVCTLDGNLTLLLGDHIVWSICVEHELFALNSLSLLRNGTDQLVVCSNDGNTYIVSTTQQIVKFQFGESVLAFCAGMFAIDSCTNVPCLIYATLNNHIVVYPNIQLNYMDMNNLVETMNSSDSVQQLFHKIGINYNPVNTLQCADINRWCLYNYPNCFEKQN